MSFYHWEQADLVLAVQVQPRASQMAIVGVQGERLKIKITAPPVDGKANAQVSQFLAKMFGVRQSQVILLQGQTSRDKRFKIVAPQQLPTDISSLMDKS